ncbi:MAG: YgfZ/GcvT domain-containing protein [Gammaproteobacteria bacterium]
MDSPPRNAIALPQPVHLPDLGVLAVRGPDARQFLNGQLSQEVLTLDGASVRLAGLHNAQGRVLAVLRLVAWADEVVLCVLPRAAIAEIRTLLARYLLRAKATLTDESDAWRIEGVWPQHDGVLPEAAEGVVEGLGAARREGDSLSWRHAADGRRLRLSPRAAGGELRPDDAARAAWHLADLAAGLPEIHPATRGAFVAQMLNLDVLGGISFTKGCYTGQEVIARAHYRGRVKRRLQRFEAAWPADRAIPAAGETLRLADGRSTQLVDAALRPDGQLEFLAVAPYAAHAATASGTEETGMSPSDGTDTTPRLAATPLPLPYALPD